LSVGFASRHCQYIALKEGELTEAVLTRVNDQLIDGFRKDDRYKKGKQLLPF